MFHTLTWVIWLVAAAVPAFTLRNPLYLILVVGASWIVYLGLGQMSPVGRSWGTFVRIGVLFVAVAVAFIALSSHFGTLVLFRLPEDWPIVGGPITLESAIAGAVNGLGLLTILAVFATFNAVVDHYQLLRATPAFAFQVGTVVSIAITFVPQMVLSAAEIRQAQRIRGHRFRGIRDLPPLFIALLTEGLERSITLAESMDARGFGGQPSEHPGRQELLLKSIIALALTVLVSGAFAISYFPDKTVGRVTMGAGGLMLVAALWMVGQNVHRSRYRRDPWLPRDTLVAAASIITMLVMLAAWLMQRTALVFYPFPRLHWPAFNPLVGLALLLIAMPALAARLAPEQGISQEY